MWHEEDPGDEPDWVEEERRQFRDFRDKDNNGFLGKSINICLKRN